MTETETFHCFIDIQEKKETDFLLLGSEFLALILCTLLSYCYSEPFHSFSNEMETGDEQVYLAAATGHMFLSPFKRQQAAIVLHC